MGIAPCSRVDRRYAMLLALWVACLVAVPLVIGGGDTAAFQEAGDAAATVGAGDADNDEDATGEGDAGEEADNGLSDLTNKQVLLVLIFAATILLMFLAFLYVVWRSQGYAYWVIHRLGVRGIAVRIEHVKATERAVAPLEGEDDQDATEATIKLTVPAQLFLGEAGLATATVTGLDAFSVAWSSDNPALQVEGHGATAKITGTELGVFILTATIDGQPELKQSAALEVVEKPAADGAAVPVPFMGAGVATAGIVFLLFLLLAVLGVTGVLDGDQLLPVITAIVGGFIGAIAVAIPKNQKEE